MDCHKVALADTHRFSKFFIDYLSHKEELQPFYNRFPAKENVLEQIRQKHFDKDKRAVLYNSVKRQYKDLHLHENVAYNLESLKKDNTFTIVTGHQLNIFGGPLYFIYKIVTVIEACKALKKEYPEYNFIPVYWMASEDHDFDEISYIRYQQKKIKWETDQKGAVGHFEPASVEALFSDIPGLPEFFKEAYAQKNLAAAVRYYVNHLFESEGLMIIDGDDPDLKAQFKYVIKDDLLNNTAKSLVEKTSSSLESLGYKTQVFSREINFFYLEKDLRERIEKGSLYYEVLGTDKTFSEKEILKEIEQNPEKFSPNVILRPVYQEAILPNLAYVGGPAEVIYWLQLKGVFDHYKIPFPMVMPRNFGMVIPEHIDRKLQKAELETDQIFAEKHELLKQVVIDHSTRDLHLNGQRDKMVELFNSIKSQAEEIDPTLGPHVEAQLARTRKRLDVIEKKFIRAEKKNQEDRLRQVESVLDYLFPGGGLQERTDNFLNFYIGNPKFIEDLHHSFDPFDFRFHILNYGK